MIWLLDNWRVLISAAFVAISATFYGLWQMEKHSFTSFKLKVEIEAKAAEAEAKRIDILHKQTLKDISDDYNKRIDSVRQEAVNLYIATHPSRVLPRSSDCPAPADRPQSPDGTGKEPVPIRGTCEPDLQLVQDAAEDALKLSEWQEWAKKNSLPVQ